MYSGACNRDERWRREKNRRNFVIPDVEHTEGKKEGQDSASGKEEFTEKFQRTRKVAKGSRRNNSFSDKEEWSRSTPE